MTNESPIKTLAAAGKSEEARELVGAYSERAQRTFAAIRAESGDLTDEAKRRHLAAAATNARRDLNAEIEKLAARVGRTDRGDAQAVFGVDGLPGDAASLAISRRDATDRVASLDRGELRDLLHRATRSGDEVLARAIAERALEEVDDKTLHQFCAHRPHLDSAVERLWNTQRASGGGDSMSIAMEMIGLQPAELLGMSFDAIEQLASE